MPFEDEQMKRSDELRSFRKKLLERYVALCREHGKTVSISFNEFWYDFLLMHMLSETTMEIAYEKLWTKLQQSGLLYLHDGDHR